MNWRTFLAVATVAAAGWTSSANASLATYGYVTGTFVQGSNYLERLDQQGKFLHYRFKVQTANGLQYEAVIDVKNGHLYPFPQRVLTVTDPSLFAGVFASTDDYHPITMNSSGGNAAQGALDYIRHPGILKAMRQPWTYLKATPTADPQVYRMPEWDALFTGVTRLYVFGQPYSTGRGVHVVHQNQGDKKSTFYASNGLYQDGAVVFEYANGERKILMTRFDDQPNDPGQSDFSWDYDPDGTGPLRVGVARTPTVVEYRCEGYTSIAADRCRLGPFGATQIEAHTRAQSMYVPAVTLQEAQEGDGMVWLTGGTKSIDVAKPSQTMTIGGAIYSQDYARAYKHRDFTPNYYVVVPRSLDGAAIDITVRYVQ